MTRAFRYLTAVACVLVAPLAAQAFCPEIAVLDGAGGGGSVFPVFDTSVVDLRLVVDVVPDPVLAHQLGLELITPSGQRFRSFTCVVGGLASGRDCAVGPVGKLLDGDKTLASWDATVVLPVAGTQITTSSLYGTWRIVPTLDELGIDCSESYGFVITAPDTSTLFVDGFESGNVSAWSSALP